MRGRSSLFILALIAVPFLAQLSERSGFLSARFFEKTEGARSSRSNSARDRIRFHLLASLDLFVRAQRVLKTEQGQFTAVSGRFPELFGGLTQFYRLEVPRASKSTLLVLAVGDPRKGDTFKISYDRVAIDHAFRVRANFPIPEPPRDYLTILAKSVLFKLRARNPDGVSIIPSVREIEEWEGVFRGFFRYEFRAASDGSSVPIAVGERGSIRGEIFQLEALTEKTVAPDLFEWIYTRRNSDWVEQELAAKLERVFIASRIRQHHTGQEPERFDQLLPYSYNLEALNPSSSPFVVSDFQVDPAYGFHAEITQRKPGNAPKAWSVNGMGQVSEVDSVENLLGELEKARRNLAGKDEERVVNDEPVSNRKKLLIDLVPEDK